MEQIQFPNKPVFDENNKSLLKSIGSVALFIISFYVFFNDNLNYILVLVLVLFIHELGHFIAMKYFKYTEVKMFFIPLLGALVMGEKKEISQKQRAIILLAGPVPGIIIGVILYAIGNGDTDFKMAANIFIFLNIFNLLPLTPLDGGNLIETLFFTSKEKLQTVFIIISIIGLTIISIYLKSYILLIIPFLLLGRINIQKKIKTIKITLDNANINYNKPFEELSNAEYWQIREEIITNLVAFKNVQQKEYSVSTKENQIVNQIKSLAFKIQTLDISRKAKLLFVSIWFLCFIVSSVALGMIRESNKPRQLTTEEQREQMIQESIHSTGTLATQYPKEVREYCICAVDAIMKKFSAEERKENKKLPKEEMSKLYMPIIQDCINEFTRKIKSIDTTSTIIEK